MNLMRSTENKILVFIVSAVFLSCVGQGKVNTKNAKFEQDSIGETVDDLAPNSHLIYQDKNHNYWFGNDIGIYKYDGKTVKHFTPKDGLVSTRIIGIQEDKFGNLYFDTPEGVSKFNGEQFVTLKIIEGDSEKSIWKSDEDDLWFRVGWDKKGPYKFDGNNLYNVEFPKSKIEDDLYEKYPNISFNPYGIFSMFKDSKGNVWFGTSDLGIYHFDGNEVRWMHEEHLGLMPGGGAFGIRSIIEDKEGFFWICNNSHKYKVLPDIEGDDTGLQLLNYSKEKGVDIADEEVLYFMSMVLDDNGSLWMVNNDGIWKNNGEELVAFFISDGAKNISPTSIYKDHKGDLWFGTPSDGIYIYEGMKYHKATFSK